MTPNAIRKAEVVADMKEAFNLGIPGWYVDEGLYVRRGDQSLIAPT